MKNNITSHFFNINNKMLIYTVLLFTLVTCTEQNVDTSRVPKESYDIDYRSSGWGEFPNMINSINELTTSWQFQIQEYLNAGQFSQMYASAAAGTYGAQPNNFHLSLVDGWNGSCASVPYGTVMPSWLSVSVSASESPEYKAIANILKVSAMHKVVDAFGPAQYVKYGTAKSGVPFDNVETIYDTMISELSTAIKIIDDYLAAGKPSVIAVIVGVDAIYAGDLTKWRKLANSLKLRLAMRISMVSKDKAKKYAVEAINSGGISDNADNAKISVGTNTNPYYTYAYGWEEMRMSALAESILVGYADKRADKIFAKSTQVANTHKGIRLGGIKTGVKGYGNFSPFVVEKSSPIRLFSAAEYHFLLAEARLRDFITTGTAKEHYETGIKKSFEEYGLAADATAYLATTTKPIDYVDPVNAANNTPATVKISVLWDDASADSVKFEKIITQKWIALIPSGAEGWAEYRRTGYPRVFPSATNLSGGTVDDDGPRRLPYTAYHRANSDDKTELEKAIQVAFGGQDLPNKRLWWDMADKTFKK